MTTAALDFVRRHPTRALLGLTAATVIGGEVLGTPILKSKAMRIFPWLYIAMLLRRRKFFPLVATLLFVPKFRLRLGRADADEISLFHHIWRYLVFRRVDLKLPARIQALSDFDIRYGPWQRREF